MVLLINYIKNIFSCDYGQKNGFKIGFTVLEIKNYKKKKEVTLFLLSTFPTFLIQHQLELSIELKVCR